MKSLEMTKNEYAKLLQKEREWKYYNNFATYLKEHQEDIKKRVEIIYAYNPMRLIHYQEYILILVVVLYTTTIRCGCMLNVKSMKK